MVEGELANLGSHSRLCKLGDCVFCIFDSVARREEKIISSGSPGDRIKDGVRIQLQKWVNIFSPGLISIENSCIKYAI